MVAILLPYRTSSCDINAPDNLHLGQLAGRAAGNLLDLEAGKLLLELLELLGELGLVLGAQFVSLDSSLYGSRTEKRYRTIGQRLTSKAGDVC